MTHSLSDFRDLNVDPKALPVAEPEIWELRLYIAGQSPKSIAAFNNLKNICQTHLQGRYVILVIDLLENPKLAREDEIVAIPTLVKKLPIPLRKIIGDLSDTERTLVGLQIRPSQEQVPRDTAR